MNCRLKIRDFYCHDFTFFSSNEDDDVVRVDFLVDDWPGTGFVKVKGFGDNGRLQFLGYCPGNVILVVTEVDV